MRKLAIVVALSSTVLATPALARDGAWYVGGDFGGLIVEDLHFDSGLNPTIPSGNGTSQVALNHDYGFDAAVFVGYDLGAFRIEAEVAYKRAGSRTSKPPSACPAILLVVPPSVLTLRRISIRPAVAARARSAS
jgi:hypothetical protein